MRPQPASCLLAVARICKPRADDRLHVSKFQNFTLYTGIRPLDSQIIEASVSKDRKIHLVGKFPSHSGLI
jgi:hypothetical protein